jgi:serine/threonine protein kinase
LAVGDNFAGKYRIGPMIGSGAMGQVYEARHLLLDYTVAIRFLVPQAMDHPEAVARFVREARAAARIKSPHVVRVLDVAVEGDVPYIVMEYLQGRDLGAWLRSSGPLPVQQAIDFVLQACDAIHEAHRLDIIHRDIKPPNLFAVEQAGAAPWIKVLDFGISKTLELVPPTLPPDWKPASVVTEDRKMIGSPIYMSPEQMESARDVDVRADIWALGVTLFELVSGRFPFELAGGSLLHVYSSIVTRGPLRLRDVAAHTPAGLEAVIARCLQTNPERRYPNASELAAALVEFGSARAGAYAGRMASAASPSELVSTPYSVNVPPTPRPPLAEGIDKTLRSPGSPRIQPEARRNRLPVSIAWVAFALSISVLAILGVSRGLGRPDTAQRVESLAVSPTSTAPHALSTTPAASADPVMPVGTDGSDTQASAPAAQASRRSLPWTAPSAPSKHALRPSGPELGAGERSEAASRQGVSAIASAVAPTDSDWTPPAVPK